MTVATTTVITIIGILTVAGVGLAGYYYPLRLSTTLSTPTPSPTSMSTPTTTVPLPSSQRTLQQNTHEVRGTTTTQPQPTTQKQSTPTPTPHPTATATPPPASSDLAIAFVDTPSQVNSGQSFVVKWQVTGPSGTVGQDTQLKLSYETNKSSGESHASSSTNSSNSFGSFTVPKVFSSTFSFGNEPGELHLTATAIVGGQTLTATKMIELR